MPDSAPRSQTAKAITEVGLFASESLFVSFDFTRDQFNAASAGYQTALHAGKSPEMPSEVKTYVHELTHYIHYITTPYGLFLQLCRKMQNRATAAIVTALLRDGIPFNMPLLENLPDVSGKTAEEVNWGLSIWLNIENLVSMMHGDTDGRVQLTEAFVADMARVKAGQRPKRPPLLDLHEAFVRVQESMAEYLVQVNAEAKAAGSPVPAEPEGFDRETLQQEKAELPSRQTLGLVRGNDVFELLGGHFFSVEAIIESAATAAEFWCSPISWDEFIAWVKMKVDPRLEIYRRCLTHGLESIQTESVQEFILSFISLCELAFFSPVLPHYAALRRQHSDFRQILPSARWMELMRAASHVRPMIDLGDHDRYVLDTCRFLNWVHPTQMIRPTLDWPESMGDPLTTIYFWAQRWRAQSGSTFVGLNRRLFDPSPGGKMWRDMFDFVILDYADRTLYHPDKMFLELMTTRELGRLGMRCIMLGKSLTISAPYRGDEDQRRWMTGWLRTFFKGVFGRDFPMLKVVA
jgi:hypothetical protein